MKNWEKNIRDIMPFMAAGIRWRKTASGEIKKCEGEDCNNCDFFSYNGSCSDEKLKWLNSEYEEPKEIDLELVEGAYGDINLNDVKERLDDFVKEHENDEITISYGEFVKKATHIICSTYEEAVITEGTDVLSHLNFDMCLILGLIKELFNIDDKYEVDI